MKNQKYTVYVDDNFHYMDTDERYEYGVFEKYDDALRVCKNIVDQFLQNGYKLGITAEQMYEGYVAFGEDPWITPEPEGQHFSAWEYAKEQAKELTK